MLFFGSNTDQHVTDLQKVLQSWATYTYSFHFLDHPVFDVDIFKHGFNDHVTLVKVLVVHLAAKTGHCRVTLKAEEKKTHRQKQIMIGGFFFTIYITSPASQINKIMQYYDNQERFQSSI